MKISKAVMALGAVSLASAPVVAEAGSARVAAPVTGESEMAGGTTVIAVLFFLAAAIIAGVATDSPASP